MFLDFPETNLPVNFAGTALLCLVVLILSQRPPANKAGQAGLGECLTVRAVGSGAGTAGSFVIGNSYPCGWERTGNVLGWRLDPSCESTAVLESVIHPICFTPEHPKITNMVVPFFQINQGLSRAWLATLMFTLLLWKCCIKREIILIMGLSKQVFPHASKLMVYFIPDLFSGLC